MSTKKYQEGIGRRKTAVARVRIFSEEKKKEFLVNEKPHSEYFPTLKSQKETTLPLQELDLLGKFRITAIVKGGGKKAQADAVRHGLARALVEFNEEFRQTLSRAGFLTRDPRMRERKKFGKKRARRGAQWKKR